MFGKNGRRFCENCIDKVHKEYDLIIEYVKRHPNSNILDIIIDTGVTLKSINCLVEEGYVSYVENKVDKLDVVKLGRVLDTISNERNSFHIRKS